MSKGEVTISDTSARIQFHVPAPEAEEPHSPDQESRRIKVAGLPPEVDEEMLELQFENKRIGGGPIETLHYDSSKNAAYITYKEPEGKL